MYPGSPWAVGGARYSVPPMQAAFRLLHGLPTRAQDDSVGVLTLAHDAPECGHDVGVELRPDAAIDLLHGL